ncbi:MAG: hypothetical protein O3C13_09320 [Bacteroidetes bacterium]|nr:hypothetical protein [Bacteroidota bacterium]MDA0984679.1 hypothetical protein [Bacteroidota bacterium]
MDGLVLLSTGIDLILTIRKHDQSGWGASLLKTGILSFFYLLFVILITLLLVSVYGFLVN